jgi:hypothetical protein
MVERLVTLSNTPVVIVKHDSLPPNDKGDLTAIKPEFRKRAKRMMGDFLTYLDVDKRIGVYELVRGG